ncbi:hypothetical protein EON83_08410 [bacterium]|nr:MAG: hypothetical protein EON83_08410 [bacterium]
MKTLFPLCLLGAVMMARPVWAGYSEGLLRQQAEWLETERHFASIAPKPYVSSTSAYSFSNPYQAPAKMPRRNTPTYSAPRPLPAPQVSAEQLELERRARQEAAERELIEAVARKKRDEWTTKSLKDPYLTWHEPPAFANDQQKYQWFSQQAEKDHGAALVTAQMAWDGIGTKNGRDLPAFFRAMSNTFICRMQKALLGESALYRGKDAAARNKGLSDLYEATYWNDKSGGQARAFKTLEKVFLNPTVNGQQINLPRKIKAAIALCFGVRGNAQAAAGFMMYYAEDPLIIEDNLAIEKADIEVLLTKFKAPLGVYYARGLTLLSGPLRYEAGEGEQGANRGRTGRRRVRFP